MQVHSCSKYLCLYRMLLTKYLAETGENSEITGVVVVSALWDPPASSDGLEQFPSKQLYNWFLSRKLRDMVNRSASQDGRLFLCHV